MKLTDEDQDTFGFIGVVWIVSMIFSTYQIGVLILAYDEIGNRSDFFGGLCVAIFIDILTTFLLYAYLTREVEKKTPRTKRDEVREKNNERT